MFYNLDFIILGSVFVLYTIAWANRKREIHIEFSKEAINACITATSILLPATIAIVAFKLGKNQSGDIEILINNLIIASFCFLLSLNVGIFNLSRFPTIALKKDKEFKDYWTPILGILQLLSFFLGTIRLLRGIKI